MAQSVNQLENGGWGYWIFFVIACYSCLFLLIPKWIFLLLWDKGNVLVLFIPSLHFFPLLWRPLSFLQVSCSFFCKKSLKVYGRPLLILNGEGLWLKRKRHSKRMVPGNLFYCLKGKALLYLWWGRGWPIGGGCILSFSCLNIRIYFYSLVYIPIDRMIWGGTFPFHLSIAKSRYRSYASYLMLKFHFREWAICHF